MSNTTPESQESTSLICKAAAFLYTPEAPQSSANFSGGIKLGAIRSLPELVGFLILLLLEQGDEVVERPLFAPIAEIEESGSADDHRRQTPQDDALAEPLPPGVGYSVFIQVSSHGLSRLRLFSLALFAG